ncbi:MAG: hypothetical protein K0B02_04275 [DPANN group archaeon]|nr:hypothetical protein [DPANN group archaeon]
MFKRLPSKDELHKLEDIIYFNESIETNINILIKQSELDHITYITEIIHKITPELDNYLSMCIMDDRLQELGSEINNDELKKDVIDSRIEALASITGITKAHEMLYEIFDTLIYEKYKSTSDINKTRSLNIKTYL